MIGSLAFMAVAACRADIGDTFSQTASRPSRNLFVEAEYDRAGHCQSVIFTHVDNSPFFPFEVDVLALTNSRQGFRFASAEDFGSAHFAGDVAVYWFTDGSRLHPVQHVSFEKLDFKSLLTN
jgi:hypothetical protein